MICLDIRSLLKEGNNIYELPLRVCYYARVSTEHEEQATSIINQVDYFIKYIDMISSWKLVSGYVDEGISGKEIYRRENFKKMIYDAKEKKFDLVLTKSVSRFARNTMDSIYYTNLLLDMGIGVYFINDNINTFFGDSEFRLTLMASIAQDELRKLSESVKFGLRQSISRGIVLGNDNILGYFKDKGKLVIDKSEVEIVRDIYKLFIDGIYNYSEIARRINLRYERKFNSTSIKRILTNYKYKGYYCGKKSEVIDYKRSKRRNLEEKNWIIFKDYEIIPPIVEEEVWDRVNDIIRKRRRKNTELDVYRGKVFCKVHGRVLSKRKKYKNKYYFYYICKDCFRLSSRLIDRMVGKRDILKIVVSKGDDLKVDIMMSSY